MRTLARLMFFGPLVAWSAFAGAQGDPSPVDRSKDNPALARFGRSVVLYASFDGHEYAEITADDPQPAENAAWKAVARNHQDIFAPAYSGKAYGREDTSLSSRRPRPAWEAAARLSFGSSPSGSSIAAPIVGR